MTGETALPLPYNPEPRTVVWERLETLRLQKLGLSNKYSRHFNVLRKTRRPEDNSSVRELGFALSTPKKAVLLEMATPKPASLSLQRENSNMSSKDKKTKSNSLAPFTTCGKPTCGVFFSRETDNKKKKFGIPPSDLVKWRNISGAPSNVSAR